ncbi:MAG: acyl-CoA/acyl-ACP dehydrogenase [Betaproteobacteria bacterium]|nr:acyl-CoA/acyl-ACP dehydrogenase [Betaproteobacteria bacterium]
MGTRADGASATERQQFGRPLAGFQAVKQVLAMIATEVAAASMAAEIACEAMTKGSARFEVAVAKIRTGQAVAIACMNAHQVHGAMGFTYEHTLHFATRRLWSWRADYGNEAHWALEIGRAAIARGGDAFWEDLTAA